MAQHETSRIRNVALVGHSGSGKTSLAEQMLYVAGASPRLRTVTDHNSILDVEDLSRELEHTLDATVCHFEHEERLVHLFDTPGYPDFAGPALASLEAVETVAIVVSAHNGIETTTRRMFAEAKELGLAIVLVVNKIDMAAGRLGAVLDELVQAFGPGVVPIDLPAEHGARVVDCYESERGEADVGDVGRSHVELVERAIESDDALLDRYLGGDLPKPDELEAALDASVASEHVVPVLFTNARTGTGVRELLHVIAHFCPSPRQGKIRTLVRDGGPPEPLPADGERDGTIAQIVRIAADPRSNLRYAIARVFAGELRPDRTVFVGEAARPQRISHLFSPQGGAYEPLEVAVAGDIVAMPRLEAHIGDVVHDGAEPVRMAMPTFPTPALAQAIATKSRSDEAKLADALHQIGERDPCLVVERDPDTHETLLRGLGDLQLRIAVERMKRHWKLDLSTRPPSIPYRETITRDARGHHRLKKQTGGAGQFAEVFLEVEPLAPDDPAFPFAFAWDIVGGVVSRSFEPAVRKGCEDTMARGVLAGHPMQGVRVRVVDGKEHPVDSKEVAFRAAGQLAMRDALANAGPVVLEPVMLVEVTAPIESVGALTGDLASRRGRPLGQENAGPDMVLVRALVPLAEMMRYAGELSGMTSGRGSFEMHLASYEPAPREIAERLVREAGAPSARADRVAQR